MPYLTSKVNRSDEARPILGDLNLLVNGDPMRTFRVGDLSRIGLVILLYNIIVNACFTNTSFYIGAIRLENIFQNGHQSRFSGRHVYTFEMPALHRS